MKRAAPSKPYEELFLEALHTFDPRHPERPPPAGFTDQLSPGSKDRWRIYADGYVARFCNALASSMLDRVSALYDEGFIKQLLFDSIAHSPPRSLLMPDTLPGFAEFLMQHEEHRARVDLIDLIRLTYLRWQVLIGPDPDPDLRVRFDTNPPLDSIYLQENHGFLSSEAPIYSLWQAAEARLGDHEVGETFIPNAPEAVLFFKSSPLDLHTLSIPAPFLNFMRQLSKGESLADSLEAVDLDTPEVEAQFIQLMSLFQSEGAWVRRAI